MDYLGNAASILGAAIELKNCIYEPMKREFGYFWRHVDYVENLKDEATKLEHKKAGLQNRVEEARNNARVVLPEVESWLREVTDIQAKMVEIETEIATIQNGGFSRPLHRHLVSKRVVKIAEAMKELQKSCGFEIISGPPPPAALVPIQLGSALEFKSRKHVEKGIMASLRNAQIYKVGICGMGGVGKTTLAKRIMHRARQEDFFEEIVMVVVSQNADMLRIQEDIATSLGLKLEDKSQPSRAHLLRTRLSNGARRSLIIVDDIWKDLNLDDLGIPCSSHCKLLLTSRNRDVFKKMNVEEVHGVNLLTDAEAWHFFQLNAGNCADHRDVVSVAKQVVLECKGLPIALETVGRSLKGTENRYIWEDSLQQLRSSNPSDMPAVLKEVYRPLRWSYDALPSERVQFLFLMCCLYPEDGDIPIEDLAINAIGLGIFDEIKRLKDKRNRVYSLVETLKSRSLLQGYDEDHVTMHDVVRDVAVFIASDKMWIATHSERNDCTWISPYIRETIGLLGRSAGYPNLRLLWIHHYSSNKELKIHDHTFEGMKELHVLSIQLSRVMQLPITMMLLENLKTLVLEGCQMLETISVVGELVNLEILICRYCHSIESLPMEIGRLSGLKLLELSNCTKLKKIQPGIISKLKELEELIVWRCFDGWEAKNMGRENQNALLSELEHLSSLSRLEIEVKDYRLAAEQMRLSPNLMAYHIRIGDLKMNTLDMNSMQHIFERKMELKLLENISLGEWIYEHVKSVEHMHVEGDGSGLDFGVAHNMRVLLFKNSSTVKTLKEVFDIDVPMSSNSFNNLQELTLMDLSGLEHLNILSNFNMLSSLDVSRCDNLSSVMTRRSSLVQLKSLKIEGCKMMEQVLLCDEDEDQIVFQNLQLLQLISLPNVTSFSKGIKSIGFPVLEEMQVWDCGLMKRFVCTTSPNDDDDGDGDWMRILCKSHKFEFHSLRELKVGGYSGSMCRNWCPMMIGIFTRLSELHVYNTRNMKRLFPYSVAQNLHNLKSLSISHCDDMVVVIEDDACGGQTPPTLTPTPLLPNLKQIRLHSLPKLKSFCECKHALEFPSLTSLSIEYCYSMEEFTSGHVSTPFLPHIDTEFGRENPLNISNGVNASLKQQWLERQKTQKRVQEFYALLSIKTEVQKRVEEFDAWLSIGPPNESQLQNLRLIEAEVQKRVDEVDAWLGIGPPNESQLQNLRLIEAEEEHISQLEGSSVQQKMKAPVEITEKEEEEEEEEEEERHDETMLLPTQFTQGEYSAAQERRNQLLERISHRSLNPRPARKKKKHIKKPNA